MADMNNLHSPGSGHHHHHHPTRPFSYVQPANQSLYTYQWNMNMNPYSQYGLSALPYVRQYVAPYPYMSGCSGYVMPQAPMYPVDYRCMLNPHHYAAAPASDIHLNHYSIKRETASSEVQTEQDDPLDKLIGSLDGLSTNETPEADEVLTTSFAKDLCHETKMESPSDKGEVNRTDMKPLPQRQPRVIGQTEASSNDRMPQPHAHEPVVGIAKARSYTPIQSQPLTCPHIPRQPTASNCTTPEVNGPNSSGQSLGDTSWASRSGAHTGDSVSHETWSMGSGIDVLPLDSSSINGENENMEDCCLETEDVKGCEKLGSLNQSPDESSEEGNSGQMKNQNWDLTESLSGHKFLASAQCLHPQFLHNQDQMLHQDNVIGEGNLGAEPEKELPYRILRLPCDKVTTCMLEQEQSMWFIDPSTSSSLLSQSYGYYSYSTMQGANERQSILSLSIDELSSKDELFSADLGNDLRGGGHDRLSGKPVYTGGGKMAAETDYCSQDARLDSGKENPFRSMPPSFKRSSETSLHTCVCCGTSLQKRDERLAFRGEMGGNLPRLERPNEEVQQGGEEYELNDEELSEREEIYHTLPDDHYPGVRPQPHVYPFYPPYRHPSSPYLYPRSRKKYGYEERREGQGMGVHDEQQDRGYARHPEYCAPAPRTSKSEKFKGKRQRNGPSKTYNDKAWRERPAASDPDSWGSCGAKYKPCLSSSTNRMHEPVHAQHRRPSRKTWHEHEYKEGEESRSHRGRGSTKKRSTRR